MPRRIDITGQRFGRLTALKFSHSDSGRVWLCRCDCGAERHFKAGMLNAGSHTSCGRCERRTAARTILETGVKRCRDCGADKPLDEFFNTQRSLDGRGTYCKLCDRKRTSNWARNNRHRHLDIRRRYRYGITIAEWERRFDEQGRRCAICRADNPGRKGKVQPGARNLWQTDHCHKTNVVRGILCVHCNRMLGGAKDDIAVLEAAMAYLSPFSKA